MQNHQTTSLFAYLTPRSACSNMLNTVYCRGIHVHNYRDNYRCQKHRCDPEEAQSFQWCLSSCDMATRSKRVLSWKGAVASPIGESTLKPPKVECPKIACECTQASDSTCAWIYCIHNVRNVIREPAMITWCIARKPFKQMHARQQVNQWQVHNTNSKAVASSQGHCCWSHHRQSSMLNFHASCGSAPSRSEAANIQPMTCLTASLATTLSVSADWICSASTRTQNLYAMVDSSWCQCHWSRPGPSIFSKRLGLPKVEKPEKHKLTYRNTFFCNHGRQVEGSVTSMLSAEFQPENPSVSQIMSIKINRSPRQASKNTTVWI